MKKISKQFQKELLFTDKSIAQLYPLIQKALCHLLEYGRGISIFVRFPFCLLS